MSTELDEEKEDKQQVSLANSALSYPINSFGSSNQSQEKTSELEISREPSEVPAPQIDAKLEEHADEVEVNRMEIPQEEDKEQVENAPKEEEVEEEEDELEPPVKPTYDNSVYKDFKKMSSNAADVSYICKPLIWITGVLALAFGLTGSIFAGVASLMFIASLVGNYFGDFLKDQFEDASVEAASDAKVTYEKEMARYEEECQQYNAYKQERELKREKAKAEKKESNKETNKEPIIDHFASQAPQQDLAPTKAL